MTRKTEGVQLLVQEVLAAEFSEPYGEDIILKVCNEIQDEKNHPEWRRRYDELSMELSTDVVNQWIDRYVKEITGLNSLREVPIVAGHIITAYTKLG